MLDFQGDPIKFMLKHRRSLLALAPGLGKTFCSILAARQLGGTTLVICPLTLVRNWRKEIKKWTGEDADIWHRYVQRSGELDKYWYITNYDTAVIRMTRNRGHSAECTYPVEDLFDNLIVDESILVKNRKTARSHAVKAIANKVENVWLLSGSPTSRFYDDMWSQFNIIDSSRFRSYWKFTDRYCEIDRNVWGTQVVGNKPNSAEYIQKDFSDHYFCRTQDQVLNLPDWIFETYDIPMGKEQYRLYSEMENKFMAELSEDDILLAPNVLSQMVRLMQFASNPILLDGKDEGAKWEALPEILEFSTKPALIWTSFIKTAEEIKRRLTGTYRVSSLTGSTTEEDRNDIVEKFQGGDLDIIVAHPKVGKFGLTLTRARTSIYLERTYDGDDYYQSLHRVRRIGTEHSPLIIHLLAARPDSDYSTIDHVIDRVLRFRKDSNIALTTGLIRKAYEGENL
jgi:SWI/SNF-related matrix-associated actin-dependent regulator of chromatin subfamily A-like protein 1